MLVVECYDPSTTAFKFVKEVYLYKDKNFKPFIKDNNSVDFIKGSSFVTNGQTLLVHTSNKDHFFSMKTGVRQEKTKQSGHSQENTKLCFDYMNNVFY